MVHETKKLAINTMQTSHKYCWSKV